MEEWVRGSTERLEIVNQRVGGAKARHFPGLVALVEEIQASCVSPDEPRQIGQRDLVDSRAIACATHFLPEVGDLGPVVHGAGKL